MGNGLTTFYCRVREFYGCKLLKGLGPAEVKFEAVEEVGRFANVEWGGIVSSVKHPGYLMEYVIACGFASIGFNPFTNQLTDGC
jgi:hypothetical protein